jgi:hypothetical protein
MDSIVANLACGIAHAERNAQHILDEEHDERRPDDVPADDEEGADDLQPDLLAVAFDGSARVGESKGLAAFDCGKQAGADSTAVMMLAMYSG